MDAFFGAEADANSRQRGGGRLDQEEKNMETTKQTVRVHVHPLRDTAVGPQEVSMEFWLAAKAEFDRIEDPLWVTEEAAMARRSRTLLEDNPASG